MKSLSENWEWETATSLEASMLLEDEQNVNLSYADGGRLRVGPARTARGFA